MIIYGINPVSESLNTDRLPDRIYIQQGKDNKRIQDILTKAERLEIPIETVGNLQKQCGQNAVHQGIAGEFKKSFVRSFKQLPEDATRLVMFDGIADPHNFGAALRVCEVFGFQHVLYHTGDSSGLTSVAAKVSAGSVFHLNLYISNLNSAAKQLQERGYRLYALEAGGEDTIYDLQLADKFCLVIGSEGKGVRFNLRRQADSLVRIPMSGRVNSLNVSCALSAALCEFSRKLQ